MCILNQKLDVCEHVTVSIGAVKVTPLANFSLYQLIDLADKALYQQKKKEETKSFIMKSYDKAIQSLIIRCLLLKIHKIVLR